MYCSLVKEIPRKFSDCPKKGVPRDFRSLLRALRQISMGLRGFQEYQDRVLRDITKFFRGDLGRGISKVLKRVKGV